MGIQEITAIVRGVDRQRPAEFSRTVENLLHGVLTAGADIGQHGWRDDNRLQSAEQDAADLSVPMCDDVETEHIHMHGIGIGMPDGPEERLGSRSPAEPPGVAAEVVETAVRLGLDDTPHHDAIIEATHDKPTEEFAGDYRGIPCEE